MILKTKRLKLITTTMDDVKNIFSLTSNENVAEFMRFDTHTDISQAQEYLSEYVDNEKIHPFTIQQLEDGAFVGFYALKNECDDKDVFDQTVFLDEKFWGKGYNQEILQFMIDYAKNTLNAAALTAHVVAVNSGSVACVEKFNFGLIEVMTFDDYPHPLNIYRLEL